MQGRSLADWISGISSSAPQSRGLYYSETLSPRLSHGWGELRALFEDRFKYIHGPRPELYDVEDDPDELRDLIADQPEEALRLHRALEAFIERRSQNTAVDAVQEVDHETRQRLAALGYIATQSEAPATVSEALLDGGIAPQDRIGDVSVASRVKQRMDEGNHLDARELAASLVARDPENAYYRGLLALAQLGLGQLDAAARTIEEAPAIVALNDGVFLNVATALFGRGGHARGLAIVERVLDAHDTAYGRYLYGEMLGALGRAAEQEAELRKAVELDARYSRALLSLASLRASAGDVEEADELFGRALEDRPLSHRAHYNFAVFLLQADSNRWDEALSHLDRAVELNARYWPAHLARLAAFVDLGERERAEEVVAYLQDRCRDEGVLEQARRLLGAS